MINYIFDSLLSADIFFAESYGDDDSGPVFWLAGPIGAVAFYSYVFLRYRNTDKRHAYEYKTESKVSGLTGSENKIGTVKGVENTSIPNSNNTSPRQRLGQASQFIETWRP